MLRHVPLLFLLLLAACARPAPGPEATSAFATGAPDPAPAPEAKRLRVAMLLPAGEATGLMLERAARLAVEDTHAPFELDVVDIGAGGERAALAARRAVADGAALLVGPVYAPDVEAVAAVALPAGVPMLGFSSDTRRARGGVYSNAFTPEADVRATLGHAVGLGSRHVVVFAPDGRYGEVVIAQARKTLGRLGAQVAFVARTDGTPDGYRAAAHEAAIAVEGADTIYIPEGGRAPRAIMGQLAKAGTALGAKRLLGSGQWRDADLADARLDGALFAANDERAFRTFAYRYEARHAQKPTALAALAYDAVAAAVALARRSPGRPWTRAALESAAGFQGATGLFRFRADGTVERMLAIREVRDGAHEQVKVPAPRFGNNLVLRTTGPLTTLGR